MNKKDIKVRVMLSLIIVGMMGYMIFDKPEIAYDNIKTNCEEDSLRGIVDSLQAKIESDSRKFDIKEDNYKRIIDEYKYGIDRLETYHPKAYEDFHRVISFKENYSRVDEIENKKRLNYLIN